MSRTLRYLLTIVLIIAAAMWLLTVYRSCKNTKPKTELTDNGSTTGDSDASNSGSNLDDLYDDEEEDDGEEAPPSTDDGTASDSDGDAGSDGDDDASEFETDDEVSVSGAGINRNGGEYLVVAGAFISKSNAEKYQKQLAKRSYDSEIRVFIGSDYHSVIIGEYATESEARSVAKKIGGEAYAHKKRYPKKRRR